MTESLSPSPELSRPQLIGEMGRRIHRADMSTGALASLRRGARFDVARQAAFYSITADIPEHMLEGDATLRWAALAQGIAITGAFTGANETDGSAMAKARLSEARFARLLASHGEGLFDQLLLVARFMHSKNAPLTWKDLGEMVLTDGVHDVRADAARLRLAREYYRAHASLAAA